jgi:hypothetical protein
VGNVPSELPGNHVNSAIPEPILPNVAGNAGAEPPALPRLLAELLALPIATRRAVASLILADTPPAPSPVPTLDAEDDLPPALRPHGRRSGERR